MIAEWMTWQEAEAGPLRRVNSYSRLPTILGLEDYMDRDEWLTLLGRQWTGCDNIGPNAQMLWESLYFQELCEYPLELRPLLMTPEERAELECLPDMVTVWRGCYAINKRGWSWSLSEEVARQFPTCHRYRRNGEQALIIRAEVHQDRILALKTDRNEAEVVALGPKIRSIRHLR